MQTVPNEGLITFRAFLNEERLAVTTPQGLAEVLVTKAYDFEKPPPLRNILRKILGDGLIIVEGDLHRFQRKNVLPAFSFRHIKDLYPVFWDKATTLVQRIEQTIAENPVPDSTDKSGITEINHWGNLVTMDIIGLAAMGRDIDSLRNAKDPLTDNYEEVLEPTTEKQLWFVANILAPSITPLLPWKVNYRFQQITHDLTELCLEQVRVRKAGLKANSGMQKDILSLLLQTGNFSDQQLVDQMLTFLAAGHETTSSAFTWATYLLTQHPQVCAALRAEIRAQLPGPGQPVPGGFDLATTLESLPLLNGVIQETLRLFPTVPVTVRVASRDTTLLGHPVPKGTFVQICPFAINRSPDLWGNDAEEFRPSRWIDTDENTGEQRANASGGAQSNYANLTFLHGPRSCIGQGFAKAELRAITAAFVGSFEFQMADPTEKIIVSGSVTTKPKNGMHLLLKPVHGW